MSGEWLDKVRRALAGESTAAAIARSHLQAACRARRKIALQSMARPGELGPIALAVVEQVREDDIVIAQPTIGGCGHPLATNEPLLLSFVTHERVAGETRCLGRIKVRSGSGGMLYGYRLALPERLEASERRAHYRVFVAYDLAPEAEIRLFDQPGAILGVVEDLSVGGAKIRTRNASSRLHEGDRAYVKIMLPAPVHELSDTIRVRRVEPGRQPGQHLVGVEFENPVEGLADVVKTIEERRSRRQRAG